MCPLPMVRNYSHLRHCHSVGRMLVSNARSRPIVENAMAAGPQYIGISIHIHMQKEWVNFQTTEKTCSSLTVSVAKPTMRRVCYLLFVSHASRRAIAAATAGFSKKHDRILSPTVAGLMKLPYLLNPRPL